MNHPFDSVCATASDSLLRLLEKIPESADRVLHIGCGGGSLGRQLKERQEAEVVGLEPDCATANVARRFLDAVYARDLDALDVDFENSFDVVICEDVVASSRTPEARLRRIAEWISDEGTLLVRVANSRLHSRIVRSLDDRWGERCGAFSRSELDALLTRSGYVLSPRLSGPARRTESRII